jgi:ATP-binding cassette subfamily G (WHITE) protein 2 (PDR)
MDEARLRLGSRTLISSMKRGGRDVGAPTYATAQSEHSLVHILAACSFAFLNTRPSVQLVTMAAPAAFTQQTSGADVTLAEKAKLESSSSSDTDRVAAAELEVQRDHDILELVRKYTVQSIQHDHGSPFEASEGSQLDPQSASFRARDWAKSFYGLRYSSNEAIARVAGFAFQGLNVNGKGSPTDFQSTVGNTILKLPALFGRGSQKIEILRDLDGLVLPGEQLCVLGPPG